MYVYYDKTGTLKTQINHGEILRQGSDFNLTICFDPDYVEDWSKIVVTANILLPDGKTQNGFKAALANDIALKKFEKTNDSEMTYALVPNKYYKMFDFQWLHSLIPSISDYPGNLKIEIGVYKLRDVQIDSEQDQTNILYEPDQDYILSVIDRTYIQGVINAFVEAVFGFVPSPTIDDSTDHYEELKQCYIDLVNEINNLYNDVSLKQDKVDSSIEVKNLPEEKRVVEALNSLQLQVDEVAEQAGATEIYIAQLDTDDIPSQYLDENGLPVPSYLSMYVYQNARARGWDETNNAPRNGCSFLIVKNIPRKTDELYKYLYTLNNWEGHIIPNVEKADYDSFGIVEGTYSTIGGPSGQTNSDKILFNINNGKIVDAYAKGFIFIPMNPTIAPYDESKPYYYRNDYGNFYIVPSESKNENDYNDGKYFLKTESDSYASLVDLLATKIDYATGYITNIQIDGLTVKFTLANGTIIPCEIQTAITDTQTVQVLTDYDTEINPQATERDLVSGNLIYDMQQDLKGRILNDANIVTYPYSDTSYADFINAIATNWAKIEYVEMQIDTNDLPLGVADVLTPFVMNINGTDYSLVKIETVSGILHSLSGFGDYSKARFYPTYKSKGDVSSMEITSFYFSTSVNTSLGISAIDPLRLNLALSRGKSESTEINKMIIQIAGQTRYENQSTPQGIIIERERSKEIQGMGSGNAYLDRNIVVRYK